MIGWSRHKARESTIGGGRRRRLYLLGQLRVDRQRQRLLGRGFAVREGKRRLGIPNRQDTLEDATAGVVELVPDRALLQAGDHRIAATSAIDEPVVDVVSEANI